MHTAQWFSAVWLERMTVVSLWEQELAVTIVIVMPRQPRDDLYVIESKKLGHDRMTMRGGEAVGKTHHARKKQADSRRREAPYYKRQFNNRHSDGRRAHFALLMASLCVASVSKLVSTYSSNHRKARTAPVNPTPDKN